MEEKDTAKGRVESPHLRTVAIALNGGSKSKFIARWAIEKFIPEGNLAFKLLHVFPKITGVPTPSKCDSISPCSSFWDLRISISTWDPFHENFARLGQNDLFCVLNHQNVEYPPTILVQNEGWSTIIVCIF